MIYTIGLTKGGVAKTSSAGALGELAARAGKRVLLVDLDSQCNLSFWYRGDLSRPGSYELITGAAEPTEVIQPVGGGLSLIAGSANLTGLKTSRGSASRLYTALNALKDSFNFIVIDTGPGMNEALFEAITAANRVLIPLETDTNSLQAFYQLADVIRHIKENRPTIKIGGVFLVKYDARPRINRVMRDNIIEAAADEKIPYLGEIRAGVCVRECQALQIPLFEYSPKSKPAQDYAALYDRIKGVRK